MFSSLKQRLMLGVYVFIILSIPVGAYFLSVQQTSFKGIPEQSKESTSSASITKGPKISTPSAKQKSTKSPNLSNLIDELKNPSPSPSPTSDGVNTTLPTSYGPTLSFKIALEGRPPDNQKIRLFVGIMEGSVTQNPKFLLSFTIDVPESGTFSGLSLAGLESGKNYTALLKGTSQIATASAFTMSPTESKLNSSEAVFLLSGDLNEDNVINTLDYSICIKAYNSKTGGATFNSSADFNKDGIVNTFDIAFILKNFGKIGDSGAWVSPIPTASPTATPSASLSEPKAIGGTGPASTPSGELPVGTSVNGSNKGYWIWVPK